MVYLLYDLNVTFVHGRACPLTLLVLEVEVWYAKLPRKWLASETPFQGGLGWRHGRDATCHHTCSRTKESKKKYQFSEYRKWEVEKKKEDHFHENKIESSTSNLEWTYEMSWLLPNFEASEALWAECRGYQVSPSFEMVQRDFCKNRKKKTSSMEG